MAPSPWDGCGIFPDQTVDQSNKISGNWGRGTVERKVGEVSGSHILISINIH